MSSRISRSLLMLSLLVSLFACSQDESPEEEKLPETPDQAADSFHYIALKNNGILFSIGDNTGKVEQIGSIPGIEFNTLFNSVTSSGTKTFIYEHRFDPPRGTLYVWDKKTGKTESAILNFPEEFGVNTALMSLDWDQENQNLIGITREDLESSTNYKPIKIVRINPESFEVVTSSDIDLQTEGYGNVYSTSLVGQKLYAVALEDTRLDPDLLEIDLEQDVLRVLPVSGSGAGITNIGNNGNQNNLFGFSPVVNSKYMAEVRPVVYDITSGTINELYEVPRISSLGFSHKTYYNEEGDEFAELVGANNKIQLFKYNPSTGDYQLTELSKSENLSTLISIVGVRKI